MLRCVLPLPLTRIATCVQLLPGRSVATVKNRWYKIHTRDASASCPSDTAGSGIGAAPASTDDVIFGAPHADANRAQDALKTRGKCTSVVEEKF